MKKSLIALAAAGMFAPAAFAATANVDVYGIVSMAIEDTDASGVDVAVVDRVSRIGFKGSEDLGNGLKAIWQIEQQISATGNTCVGGTLTCSYPSSLNSAGAFGGATLRNTFVGLAGDFGVFVMGRHDTPYKLGTGSLDIFADTLGDYNGVAGGVDLVDSVQDYRSPQAIAYISPTWSGFHFAVATVATNTVGNLDNGDSFDAFSATAVYVNGPLFLSGSYQTVELVDSTAWKLGAGYTFGDLKVGAIYENVDYNAILSGERDSWLVNAAYTMGPVVLKAEYGQVDYGSTDADAWVVGVDYNLSKRTTAYALYANSDNGSSDVSGWALGLKHSF